MAEEAPLLMKNADGDREPKSEGRNARLASLDVFRGLSVSLMIFVDYAGPLLPLVAHSPWNGVHLADFVMPFFLFIVGVSLPLVYKNVKNRMQATCKASLRAVELFILGILVQVKVVPSAMVKCSLAIRLVTDSNPGNNLFVKKARVRLHTSGPSPDSTYSRSLVH